MFQHSKSTLWGVLAPIIGVALINVILWSMGGKYPDRVLTIPNLVLSALVPRP